MSDLVTLIQFLEIALHQTNGLDDFKITITGNKVTVEAATDSDKWGWEYNSIAFAYHRLTQHRAINFVSTGKKMKKVDGEMIMVSFSVTV